MSSATQVPDLVSQYEDEQRQGSSPDLVAQFHAEQKSSGYTPSPPSLHTASSSVSDEDEALAEVRRKNQVARQNISKYPEQDRPSWANDPNAPMPGKEALEDEVFQHRVAQNVAKEPDEVPGESNTPGDLLIQGAQASREAIARKGGEIGANILEGIVSQPAPETMGAIPADERVAPPVVKGVARGVGRTIGSVAADPFTWIAGGASSAAGKTGARLISGAFAADMGAGTYEQAKQLREIWSRPDVPSDAKAEATSSLIMQGLMTIGAAKHALTPHPVAAVPPPDEATQALINYEKATGNPQFQEPAQPAPQINLDPDHLQNISAVLAGLPHADRQGVITKLHPQLAEQLLKTGSFLGPDGKLHIVKTPEEAGKLAQQFINDAVDSHDKRVADEQKAHAEAAKAAAQEPAPSQSSQPVRRFLERSRPAPQPATKQPLVESPIKGLSPDRLDAGAWSLFQKENFSDLTSEQQDMVVRAYSKTRTPQSIATPEGQHYIKTGEAAKPIPETLDAAPVPGEGNNMAGEKPTETLAPSGKNIEQYFWDKIKQKDLMVRGAWTGEGLRRDFDLPPGASLRTLEDRNIIRQNKEGLWELSPRMSGEMNEKALPPSKESEPAHKNASTQINIEPESDLGHAHAAAVSAIPDEHIGKEGRETTPHVTVRYGLQDDSPAAIAKIKQAASKIPPFEVPIGKTEVFPATEHSSYDHPVIARLETTPELKSLRKAVEGAGDFKEDNFPEYKPHVTLAYVKPEFAEQYKGGSQLEGQKVPVKEITVSKNDGSQETIPLGDRRARPRDPTSTSAVRLSQLRTELRDAEGKKDIVAQHEISQAIEREAAVAKGEHYQIPESTAEGITSADVRKHAQSAPGIVAPAKVQSVSKVEPGQVGEINPRELSFDPKRFQYKAGVNDRGVTNQFAGGKFNPDLAGIVSVWRDASDGKTYVVNGHHRAQLALDNNSQGLVVRHIAARDATEARSIGALQNIAEGRGTAIDAAKFFRDTNYDPEKLRGLGVFLTESKVKDGLALSRLDPFIFEKVSTGEIPESRAIAIGEATNDPAQQEAIFKLLEKREARGQKVTNETVSELARFVSSSGNRTVEQGGLFGANNQIHSLALEKAEISAYIKAQIGKEKRAFAAVASPERAQTLGRVEGQQIKAGENRKISDAAAQAEEAYNKLSSYAGPVSEALNKAARELASGNYKPEEVKQRAYSAVRDELRKTLSGAAAEGDRGSQENPSGPAAASEAEQPLYSVERQQAPTFFSKAEKVADEKLPKIASAQSVISTLKNAGVKDEEIKWMGLEDWLKDKGQVSKPELLEFIRENNVQVKEVFKGGHAPKDAPEIDSLIKKRDELVRLSEAAESSGKDASQINDQIKDVHRRLYDLMHGDSESKFEQHQFSGGQNYRELLLTLPEKDTPLFADFLKKQGVTDSTAAERQQWLADPNNKWRKMYDKAVASSGGFKSSHFEEPNILAHVRFNERTDANGKRVLFLEELQSDWHQKGRREGYKQSASVPEFTLTETPYSWLAEDANGKTLSEVGKKTVSGKQEAQAYLERYLRDKAERESKGVPDAPFKTSWHELALKRILRYAAENGYDRIGWTTGEQQAERYDLSKQAQDVWYLKNPNGTYALGATGHNGQRIDLGGSVQESTLADIVGKDLAEKIAAGGGERKYHGGASYFSGTDLKVGGQGMKGFYDKILPDFLNKYGKKWGAKVGETQISVGEDDKKYREAERLGDSAKIAEALGGKETVHSLDITPSMRDSVLYEGQPMFSREPGAGMSSEEIRSFVKQAGGKLRIEEAGSQGSLFGEAEKVYRLKNSSGQSTLVTQTQMDALRKDFPALDSKVTDEGVAQPGLFNKELTDRFKVEQQGSDWIIRDTDNDSIADEGFDSQQEAQELAGSMNRMSSGEQVSFSYKPPQGAEPPTLTISLAARDLIADVAKMPSQSRGVNFDRAMAERVAEDVRSLADGDQENADELRALADAIKQAATESGDKGVNLVLQGAPESVGREESFHGGFQRELGQGDIRKNLPEAAYDRLLDHFTAAEFEAQYKGTYYETAPKYVKVAEIAAKIASDPNRFSPVQAAHWFSRYIEELEAHHGEEKIGNLSSGLYDRVKELYDQAKRQISERVGAHERRPAASESRTGKADQGGPERATGPPPESNRAGNPQDAGGKEGIEPPLYSVSREESANKSISADRVASLAEQHGMDYQEAEREFLKRGYSITPTRIVPGGKSQYTGNETGLSELEQLTNSIAQNASSKRSLADRIKAGAELGEKTSAKDALSSAIGRARGKFAALIDIYKNTPKFGDYEKATGEWSGADQKNALELYRFQKAIKDAVPDKLKREAISNWIEAGGDESVLQDRADKSQAPYKAGYEAALQLTDGEKTIAQNIQNLHDATLQEAIKAGILEQGVDNYIQHIYKDNPSMMSKILAEMNFNALKPNPSFAKQRVLPTYFDAEQLGYTPKDKDAGYLTAVHERSLREALAARDYIKSLMEAKASDGRPLIQVNWASAKEIGDAGNEAYLIKPNLRPGDKFADYHPLDHPSLRGWKWSTEIDGKPVFVQGDAVVHPEVFRRLKNNLGRSALRNYEVTVAGHTFKPGEKVLNTQAEIKNFILSFSGFHQATVGLHALEHKTSPFNLPELDLNVPQQDGLVKHGLMVAHFDAEEAFGEGVASGGLVTKVPAIGPLYGQYRTYLFQDYIPRLKMQMALNALDRNIKRYRGDLSEDQIYALTSNQANSAFGGLNYRMLGRNKTFQDTLRLFLMAPDFLEARGRFVGQASRPYGREQLAALMLGGAVLYTGARLLNQASDNDPHWDKPFSVVHNGQEYELRTVQGDLQHLVQKPRTFFSNRLSPFARFALLPEEQRYQKKNESALDQLKRRAEGLAPIPAQPWLRSSDDSNAQKAVNTVLKIVGINEKQAEPHKRHRHP